LNPDLLHQILDDLHEHRVSVSEAMNRLRTLPFEDLGFAHVDHHRHLRQGAPEVIFCAGKTPAQVTAIAARILAGGSNVLATRADDRIYEALRPLHPEAVYNPAGRLVTIQIYEPPPLKGTVLVVSAGTSDIPVAEEAAGTARALGSPVDTLYDVGVAGLHRLLDKAECLFKARVLVVVAGMEGALASVVGGLVAKPVIAVPTSTGYGASFGGLSALLAMLNSCASGVSVVNIDNGFGGGYTAHMINLLGEENEERISHAVPAGREPHP